MPRPSGLIVDPVAREMRVSARIIMIDLIMVESFGKVRALVCVLHAAEEFSVMVVLRDAHLFFPARSGL